METQELDFDKIFKEAKRESIPLKVQLAGPSGAGKSMSALLMASGLTKNPRDWAKIVGIDTENSLSLYANHKNMIGNFKVAKIAAPFEPERLIKALELAEQAGFEVIIIDSLTHFWSGKGGILDINNAYGGRFQDWSKTTPRHTAMVEAIKNSKCHIISTVRKKTDYVMSTDGGKNKVQKMGLANEQKDNMEYEFTVAFDIDMNHLASTSKDRTGLFMDRTPFKVTTKAGVELLSWSNGANTELKI